LLFWIQTGRDSNCFQLLFRIFSVEDFIHLPVLDLAGKQRNMRAVFRTRCLRIFPETSIPFPLEITGKFLGQPVGSSEIRSFPEAGIIDLGIGYSQKKLLLSSLT
jgi:hypothetical protein